MCTAQFVSIILYFFAHIQSTQMWKNWLIFFVFLHIMDHEYIVFVKCDCLKLPHLTNFVNESLFLETCQFLSQSRKSLHQATWFRFPKYLNIQQRCFENLKYHELFWCHNFREVRTKCLLQFHGIAVSDAGRYICLARNSAGEAEAAAEVLVNGEQRFLYIET